MIEKHDNARASVEDEHSTFERIAEHIVELLTSGSFRLRDLHALAAAHAAGCSRHQDWTVPPGNTFTPLHRFLVAGNPSRHFVRGCSPIAAAP